MTNNTYNYSKSNGLHYSMQLLCILCVLLIHSACVGNAVLHVNDTLDPELPGSMPKGTIGMKRKRISPVSQETSNAIVSESTSSSTSGPMHKAQYEEQRDAPDHALDPDGFVPPDSTPKRTIGTKRKRMPSASQETNNTLAHKKRIDALVNKILENYRQQGQNRRKNHSTDTKRRLKRFLEDHKASWKEIKRNVGAATELYRIRYAVKHYIEPLCCENMLGKYTREKCPFDAFRKKEDLITNLEKKLADVPGLPSSSSTSDPMHKAQYEGQRGAPDNALDPELPGSTPKRTIGIKRQRIPSASQETNNTLAHKKRIDALVNKLLEYHKQQTQARSRSRSSDVKRRLKYFLEHHKASWKQIKNNLGNEEWNNIRYAVGRYVKPLCRESMPKNYKNKGMYFDNFRKKEGFITYLEKRLASVSEEAPESELKRTQASPDKGKQQSVFNVFLENFLPGQNNNAPPTKECFLDHMRELKSRARNAQPLLSSSQQEEYDQWLADFDDALYAYEQDPDKPAQAALERLEKASKAFLPR